MYQDIKQEILQETRAKLEAKIREMAEKEIEDLFPAEKKNNALNYYLYCFTRFNAELATACEQMKGIDESRIYTIAEKSVTAVVSNLPAGEFNEQKIEKRLKDMKWIEKKAQEHQEVLMELMKLEQIIPLRFCTIYRNKESILDFVAEHYGTITDGLQKLEGQQEWGVKVYCDPDNIGQLSPEAAGKSSSKAYFTWKDKKTYYAESLHRTLSREASESRVNKILSKQVTDMEGEMILNGAYLIPEEKLESFHSSVSALEKQYRNKGFYFQCTGPWPPYNFTPLSKGGRN